MASSPRTFSDAMRRCRGSWTTHLSPADRVRQLVTHPDYFFFQKDTEDPWVTLQGLPLLVPGTPEAETLNTLRAIIALVNEDVLKRGTILMLCDKLMGHLDFADHSQAALIMCIVLSGPAWFESIFAEKRSYSAEKLQKAFGSFTPEVQKTAASLLAVEV